MLLQWSTIILEERNIIVVIDQKSDWHGIVLLLNARPVCVFETWNFITLLFVQHASVSLCSSFMILLKPLQSVHLFAGPWACGTKNHFQCEAQSATSEAFQGDVFTNAAVDWHTAVYISNLEPFYLFIMESLFKGAQL